MKRAVQAADNSSTQRPRIETEVTASMPSGVPVLPPAVTAYNASRRGSLLLAASVCSAMANNNLNFLKKVDPQAMQSLINAIHQPSGLTLLMLAVKSHDVDTAKWLIGQGASLKLLCARGTSALMYAAKRGDREMMELLLAEGALIQQTDAEQRTALHHAAMHGKEQAVALLLDRGATLEQQDAQGNTALLYAVSNNHAAVVALLVERGANAAHVNKGGAFPLWLIQSVAVTAALLKAPVNLQQETASCTTALIRQTGLGACDIAMLLIDHGADVNFVNRWGHTALCDAILAKQHSMVRLLLDRKADPGCMVSWSKIASGFSPLSLAVQDNNITAMELLLEAGADIDGCKGETAPPLCHAAYSASRQTVEWLLDRKAMVNATARDGKTALMTASFCAKTETVELLLQRGATINAVDILGRGALHLAVLAGHNPCIDLLLENGASLQQKDGKGRFPLHLAAAAGHENTIELLLRHRVDIHQTNANGWTALMFAAMNARPGAVRFLLSQGADSNAKSIQGDSALHLAAAAGKDEVLVELIKQQRVEIDGKNKAGRTALFLAAQGGWNDAVRRLLDDGADPCNRDNSGWNALHAAAFHGHAAVVETLLASNQDKTFINCLSEDGFTPLSYAAREGKLGAARLLLENGADQDKYGDKAGTALESATRNGHAQVVQLLLTRRKPPRQLPNNTVALDIFTARAIDLAISKEKAGVVEVFLRSYPVLGVPQLNRHASPVIADLHSYVHLVVTPGQQGHEQSWDFAGRIDSVRRLQMLLHCPVPAKDNGASLSANWLNSIQSCATIAAKAQELCDAIGSVKNALAGMHSTPAQDGMHLTPAQDRMVCAGILAALGEASIFSAPYSGKDLSPDVEACFNQLALHQAQLLAQAGEEAEQPLVIALGNLHGTCMDSFAGKRFHPVTLYMHLTRQCGLYDIPAKRISDAFAEIWPQHEHSGTAARERAFAQALAMRSNSREALEPIAQDSAQAGNQVTFHWLLNRQLDLVNAWHKKVLASATQ